MNQYKIYSAVQFSYFELIDLSQNLNDRIEQAFGPQGLGICIVSDIPKYIEFRQKLLPLAYNLATLPKNKLQKYERPEQYYIKGWSCGVEQFKGQYDTSKGSFYNNPLYDENEGGKQDKFRISNVWPTEDVQELEVAFKNLGRLMVDVGSLLAQHIDRYIESKCQTYEKQLLYRMIKQGDSHTGRLLHYFSDHKNNTWNGWHNDHSALTALTSPIYIQSDGVILDDYTDKTAGLLAKNRYSDINKVALKKDCLAFQIGETLQILSGGIVEATPHCVVQGEETKKLGLNRNTFAVFMGPKYDKIINPPQGITPQQAMNKDSYNVPSLQNRWKPNITFEEYAANSIKAYAKND